MKKYKAYYTFKQTHDAYTRSEHHDFEAPDPISALNQFHKFMQLSSEVDGVRTIRRARLKHSEYTLTKLAHVYHDCGFQADITSTPIKEVEVVLPKSPNPNLTKPEPRSPSQAEMNLNS